MSAYLFRRGANWTLRLQRNGKAVWKSLGTTDKTEAELLALPLIAAHKAKLLAERPQLISSSLLKHAIGERPTPDGGRVIASDKTAIFLAADGSFIRSEDNRIPTLELSPLPDQSSAKRAKAMLLAAPKIVERIEAGEVVESIDTSADDRHVERYISDRGFEEGSQPEREARAMWSLFKTLTGNKPLKDCKRDDGRLLVKHLQEAGDKPATIKKKISRLCAAVNMAIDEGELSFNPFAKIAKVTKADRKEGRRVPLSDSDVETCLANIGKLSAHDQLAFRFILATGCRGGEVFHIDGEHSERGVRYVILGSKTDASERRLPIPASVLPYLPKRIEGRLFSDNAVRTLPRLNRWLEEIGVYEKRRKVIHSLRHRAADKLRAAECPANIRYALLGHEDGSIAEGYGEGEPVTLLKRWVDKIHPLTNEAKSPSLALVA